MRPLRPFLVPFCLAFLVPAVAAQAPPVAPVAAGPVHATAPVFDPDELERFRTDLLELSIVLDRVAQPGEPDAGALERRIRDLDAAGLAYLYAAFENPAAIASSVRLMTAGLAARPPSVQAVPVVVGTNTPAFPPPYPSGGVYATFTATLDGLGALSDSNGDGSLADERCSADFEAGVQLALAIEKAAAFVAQALCDSLVVILGEGTNAPACIAAGIANGLMVATETLESQCSLQDALVDSAEIEAAYENSVILVDALTCQTVPALRRGHGCDGADEDCDLVADECGEDVFAPDLDIDGAVSLPWFESFAAAAAAVAEASSAVDDCQTSTIGPPALAGTCDAVLATVGASDACGNATSATAVVKVDGTPPAVSIGTPEDACFTTVAAAEAGVLSTVGVVDDCGAGAPTLHSSVTECALRIRAEATDRAGNSGSAAVTVRVDDEIPTVDIARLLLGFRGEVLGFQTPVCYDTVAAAEQAVATVTRNADNCTATENLVTAVASAGDACSLEVTASAVDQCGNANSDTVTLRVDAVLPTASCAVTLDRLQPGNHEMVDVGFTFSATDNCLAPGPETIVTVTSDEPTASAPGAGNFAPDAEILRDPTTGEVLGVRLRAERSSQGDGRVYKIKVTAIDACGNVGEAICPVEVRKTKNAPAVDNGPLYDATAVN